MTRRNGSSSRGSNSEVTTAAAGCVGGLVSMNQMGLHAVYVHACSSRGSSSSKVTTAAAAAAAAAGCVGGCAASGIGQQRALGSAGAPATPPATPAQVSRQWLVNDI
jgi:hypothetical protein